jgi:hypothetical protein
MIVQTQRGGPPPPAAGGAHEEMPKPQLVDLPLVLDDYKPVDGIMLPHHLSRSVDGKPSEEMTFTAIKLNPAFKPDAFSGK